MNTDKFIGWIASLSDGSEVFEAEPAPGEPTGWQALLSYIKKTGVRVTMLRLVRSNVTIAALPPKITDGYFQAYEASKSLYSGESRLRQGIGSVVGEKVFITWVNDFGNVWQDVRELSEVRIHTTLRD